MHKKKKTYLTEEKKQKKTQETQENKSNKTVQPTETHTQFTPNRCSSPTFFLKNRLPYPQTTHTTPKTKNHRSSLLSFFLFCKPHNFLVLQRRWPRSVFFCFVLLCFIYYYSMRRFDWLFVSGTTKEETMRYQVQAGGSKRHTTKLLQRCWRTTH